MDFTFKKAVPVWETGKETEKNCTLVFKAVIENIQEAVISIGCHGFYQLFINGVFAAAGPARAAHEYYRVDEIDISEKLSRTADIITVYVTGYNIKNFYIINQPSFLCCEIVSEGKVIAATGSLGFSCERFKEKVRKVQRYSYQRGFAEVYHLGEGYKEFDKDDSSGSVLLEKTGFKKFITRDVYYPDYKKYAPESIVSRGNSIFRNELIRSFDDRAIVLAGKGMVDGFLREELELESTKAAGSIEFEVTDSGEMPVKNNRIPAGSFYTYDFGKNKTGFISLDFECSKDTWLYIAFDELISDGIVNYTRLNTANVIVLRCAKGKYSFTSLEPYELRYLCIISEESEVIINDIYITKFGFREIEKTLCGGSGRLSRIYSAALETFSQNVLDLYMDCPSRERAGWLCDSFFMARAEFKLTGKSVVEKNFLENFILPEQFKNLPDGMLPMCYPADFQENHFIPNWAMWFVLELEEYKQRTNDNELISAARHKMYKLLEYFRRFENEYGLLEKLQAWIFVDWSKSNEFTNDINFPTNMLYAKMKEAMGRLYEDKCLIDEAQKLKSTIREWSYKNGFFHDRGIRNAEGAITVPDDITESCQYYAFFTKTATPPEYEELWEKLIYDFGPERINSNKWEKVHFANNFIGNMIRLEVLSMYKAFDTLLENIEGYYNDMAQKTGTLWEMNTARASCNHGFNSYVAVLIEEGLKNTEKNL